MKITHTEQTTLGDTLQLVQNARWDVATSSWKSTDHGKDSFIIDLENDTSDTGMITIYHAPATGSTAAPTFTELIKIAHDGSIVFNEQSSLGAVSSATQMKLSSTGYSGRTVGTKKDNTDEAYVMEGKWTTRIWRQAAQPANAKVWDIWIETSGS